MGEHYQEHRIQPRGLRFSQVPLFVVHPHEHSVFICCKGHPCDQWVSRQQKSNFLRSSTSKLALLELISQSPKSANCNFKLQLTGDFLLFGGCTAVAYDLSPAHTLLHHEGLHCTWGAAHRVEIHLKQAVGDIGLFQYLSNRA